MSPPLRVTEVGGWGIKLPPGDVTSSDDVIVMILKTSWIIGRSSQFTVHLLLGPIIMRWDFGELRPLFLPFILPHLTWKKERISET